MNDGEIIDAYRKMKVSLFGLIGSVQHPVQNPVREDITYGGVLVTMPDGGVKMAYLRLTFEDVPRYSETGASK